jgi:putative transposase
MPWKMRKYRSYRGEVDKAAPNRIERNFKATKANEKWVTDVVKKFELFGNRLYLSPVLDLFNGVIIAYNVEERPVFSLVTKMLAVTKAYWHQSVTQLALS